MEYFEIDWMDLRWFQVLTESKISDLNKWSKGDSKLDLIFYKEKVSEINRYLRLERTINYLKKGELSNGKFRI